jgi:hypothetical protein
MTEGRDPGERGSRPFNAVAKDTRPVNLGYCPVRSSILCEHGRKRGWQGIECPPCNVMTRAVRENAAPRAKRARGARV